MARIPAGVAGSQDGGLEAMGQLAASGTRPVEVADGRGRYAGLDSTELIGEITQSLHERLSSLDEPGRSQVGQRLRDLLSEHASRQADATDQTRRDADASSVVEAEAEADAEAGSGEAGHAGGGAARRLLPATGDRSLQTIAAVAARVLSAEAAEVSLVTDVRTIAAAAGIACTRTGERTPLREALCTLAAAGRAPLVVVDARRDERVARCGPVVRGEVGSYLGAPLVADDGSVVGALCVYDRAPRAWTADEQDLLSQIGVAAAAQLEVAALDAALTCADRQVLLTGAAHAAGIGSFSWDVAADVLVWDDPLLVTFGYADAEFPGTLEAFTSRVHPQDRARVDSALRTAIETLGEYAADFRAVRPDGSVRRLRAGGRARQGPTGGVHVLGAVTDVTAGRVAGMSEALQRSLLTELPEPDHLELVARYVPAADEAQVGGDWYDAFMIRDGATSLVIGDVTGHDQKAAVQMAQVRNVLRGIAHAVVDPPAKILHALDRAMRDLAVGALATTILAKVEQEPADAARGLRTLRWSNAGHPPPLLVHPDGRAEVLQRPSDLLLGLGLDVERHDHTQQLDPGATVLLFTDGLVERRGEHLDVGLARLAETTGRLAHLPLQQLCGELLAQLATGSDDDVALLAIRAHPEDRPRPPEAGPGTLPADLTRAEPVFGQDASTT